LIAISNNDANDDKLVRNTSSQLNELHINPYSTPFDVIFQCDCHVQIVRRRRKVRQIRDRIGEVEVKAGVLLMRIDIVPLDRVASFALRGVMLAKKNSDCCKT
jgi:hypothetical protein